MITNNTKALILGILFGALLALITAGCAMLLVPQYAEREYNELVTIAAASAGGTCTPEQTAALVGLSTHLFYYTEYLPNNTAIHRGMVDLDATIHELDEHPRPISAVFCSLKLRVINKMAQALSAASGGKPQ